MPATSTPAFLKATYGKQLEAAPELLNRIVVVAVCDAREASFLFICPAQKNTISRSPKLSLI